MTSEASSDPVGDGPLEVGYDPDTGLVPAIVQSADDGGVRMLAYMNAEALRRTLRTGRATFYSRSRGRLWEKGETSGSRLDVLEVRADCDGDTLLVRALPRGPTCHTGRDSCFEAGGAARPGDAAPPPSRGRAARDTAAADAPAGDGTASDGGRLGALLAELQAVIADRDRERPAASYTTRLLEGGPVAVARKVGEEAVETTLAAAAEPERVAEESADLLYHLLVLWRSLGLEADDVADILRRRRAGG